MRKILLSDGLHEAIVDSKNYEGLTKFTWHFVQKYDQPIGYAQCWNPAPNAVLMHRLIIGEPEGMFVHHIDNNTLNNLESNLAVVTPTINQLLRTDTMGYFWEGSRNKWKSQIMVEGSNIFIGRFNTEEEARTAYLETRDKVLTNLIKEAGIKDFRITQED